MPTIGHPFHGVGKEPTGCFGPTDAVPLGDALDFAVSGLGKADGVWLAAFWLCLVGFFGGGFHLPILAHMYTECIRRLAGEIPKPGADRPRAGDPRLNPHRTGNWSARVSSCPEVLMLYPLTIAIGLALGVGLAPLVSHPGARMAIYACSLASFVIAALAAAGVFH